MPCVKASEFVRLSFCSRAGCLLGQFQDGEAKPILVGPGSCRLFGGNRCRRCCAFLSTIVDDTINPFGVLERILYWWCSAQCWPSRPLPQRCDAVQFALPSDFPLPVSHCVYRTSSNWPTLCYCGSPEGPVACGSTWSITLG
jgi:hypothetical protein